MLPCITELQVESFKGLKPDFSNICTLELTVATGLEEVAAQECKEKLSVNPFTYRGRIITDIPIDSVAEVLKLRAVENINIIIFADPNFQFSNEREECFQKLYQFVNFPDWRKGVKVWKLVFKITGEDHFEGEQDLTGTCCVPKPEIDLKLMKNDCQISENLPEEVLSSIFIKREEEAEKKEKEKKLQNCGNNTPVPVNNHVKNVNEQRQGTGPKFRVTCHRVGSTHKFGSSEAARQFGGGINDRFGWPVDLTKYDLEVLLNIINSFVYVGFSLTREPLFKRNLTHFGPTNLRSTICYNMIQLAKLEPGDFVLDPMCGGSSIPIEGSLTYPKCFYLGGDNFEAAVTRSRMNIEELIRDKKCLPIDTIQWDATKLPFRDQTVDVVICDLPFGKRIGSRVDNRVLYFKSLVELARVTKLKTGRAVLLTHDKKSITKSLFRVSSLWNKFSTRMINIGGLIGGIYLLQRTGILSDPSVFQDNNTHSGGGNKGRKRKLNSEQDEQ